MVFGLGLIVRRPGGKLSIKKKVWGKGTSPSGVNEKLREAGTILQTDRLSGF